MYLHCKAQTLFYDTDADPEYNLFSNTDTTDNLLVENSDVELNDVCEPINIENVDLLVDFIENSGSEEDNNYIDNEHNIFNFTKDPPYTTLTFDTFNFNELCGPNIFVDIKSSLQNFNIFIFFLNYINILLINLICTPINVVKI